MAAPVSFNLPIFGTAPNQYSTETALEAAVQQFGDKVFDEAIKNSGKMFSGRESAVTAGQAALPASLGLIATREGNYIVFRSPSAMADDPLFDTSPQWGVVLRAPNDAALDRKADLANSGKTFVSRASAVAAGQDALPASLGQIETREGDYLVLRSPTATADDPLFEAAPRWGVVMRVPAAELLDAEVSARQGKDDLISVTLAPVQDRTASLILLDPISFGARLMQPEAVTFDFEPERGYWLDTGLPWLPDDPFGSFTTFSTSAEITVSDWSFDLDPLRGYVTATGAPWSTGGGGGQTSPDADLLIGFGQSNEDYQSGSGTSLVFGAEPVPEVLTLARGNARDVWLGQTLGGGASEQLAGASITGIAPLLPQTVADGPRGTGSVEAAARKWTKRKGRRVIAFTLAEGGQRASALLDSASSEYWAAKNVTTALTRARQLWPSDGNLVWRWMPFQQGESNRDVATLGATHERIRAECEAKAQSILGQAEVLRMLDWQFSSTAATGGGDTGFVGAQSILDFAIGHNTDQSVLTKAFFCGGPTYPYPWSDDFLHQSSVGHAMRGEFLDAVARRVEDEGWFLPLCPLSAAVTGANQITVTLSEAVEIATDTHVAAVANHGISVAGATISSVSASGKTLVITTSNAASGATAVGFGAQRQTDPRTADAVPRTNLRAVRPLGAYSPQLAAQSSGGLIRNWCAHRIIPVT